MNTIPAYQLDSEGYFLNEAEADESPLEPGVWHTPAGCVLDAPPVCGEHQWPRYVNGSWQVVPDYRGVTFWVEGLQYTIEQRGEVPPANAVYEKPVTLEEQLAAIARDIDTHFDRIAQADRWDYRLNCVMRAGYPNPWQERCARFATWMDGCYSVWYQIEDDIRAGQRSLTSSEQVISEFPTFTW